MGTDVIRHPRTASFSSLVQPETPSCLPAHLKAVVRVLKESGHFCHSADWVVQELAKDILRAISNSDSSL